MGRRRPRKAHGAWLKLRRGTLSHLGMSDEQRRRPQVNAPRTSLVDSAWDDPGARPATLAPPRAAVAKPRRSEESVTEEIDDLLDLRDDEPERPGPRNYPLPPAPPTATQAPRKLSAAPVRNVGASNDDDLFESALTGAAPKTQKPLPPVSFQTRIGMGAEPASPLPRFGSDPTESAPELEILEGPLPRFDGAGAGRGQPSALRRDAARPPSAAPPSRDASPFRPPSAPPPPRPPSAPPPAALASPKAPAASLVTAPLGSVGDYLARGPSARRGTADETVIQPGRKSRRAPRRSLGPGVKFIGSALVVVAALAALFVVFQARIIGFAAGVFAGPKSSAPVASAVSSKARVAPSAAPVASSVPAPSAVSSAPKKRVEPPAQPAPAPRPVATAKADLAELEGLKQHTAQQALTLSNEHAADRGKAVRELGQRLARDATLISKPEVVEELRSYAAEGETARDALAALAVLPGPVGSDLLYDVWTRTPKRTPLTELAEALNYAKDVRPRASPALGVALDLRRAESCPVVKTILPRAIQHGDRRALPPLVKLMSKRGCGPAKRDDCFACLGKRDDVRDAIKAAQARKEPKYWAKCEPSPSALPLGV